MIAETQTADAVVFGVATPVAVTGMYGIVVLGAVLLFAETEPADLETGTPADWAGTGAEHFVAGVETAETAEN